MNRNEWDDEDEWDDDESPDDDFESPDDDEGATIACPYCGEAIHEDSERCPHCERYISTEDAPPAKKPWWLLVGAAAGLYAIYRLITG
jgi:hypothetical protein